MQVTYTLNQKEVTFVISNTESTDELKVTTNGETKYSSKLLNSKISITLPIESLEYLLVTKGLYSERLELHPNYKIYVDSTHLNYLSGNPDKIEILFFSQKSNVGYIVSNLIAEILKTKKINNILQRCVEDFSQHVNSTNIEEKALMSLVKEVWCRAQSPYWEHADWDTLEQEENLN